MVGSTCASVLVYKWGRTPPPYEQCHLTNTSHRKSRNYLSRPNISATTTFTVSAWKRPMFIKHPFWAHHDLQSFPSTYLKKIWEVQKQLPIWFHCHFKPRGTTNTNMARQAIPLCTADKSGMVTCLDIHKSINSPAPILEGWAYKTVVFKQLTHGSQRQAQVLKPPLISFERVGERNPGVVMHMNLGLLRAWIKQAQRGGLREKDGVAVLVASSLRQVSLSKGGRNLQHVPSGTLKHWHLFAVCLMRL